MSTVGRILGEAMTQKLIHKDPQQAVNWAKKYRQRFPEAEPYIATSAAWAYVYAYDVIRGRFPEAEPYIAKYPFWSYTYAKDVIRGRWPEAEAIIATDPQRAKEYVKAFPKAKLEWVLNGLMDWTDL